MRGLPHFDDPDLVVGTDGFSDAGVYRLRDDLLIVQSLDFFPPLVDDPFTFGQIAAANALSDVYAMGAHPKTALNMVGFPDDQLPLDILARILAGGAERVKEAGAVIAGGHSVRDAEIKYGLSVTGVVAPDRLITNRRAQPGDVLVLTKGLGTGFITTAAKSRKCDESVLQAAVESMILLNRVGPPAAEQCGVRAATDITGFGLAGHACELAESSGVTLRLRLSALPVLPGALQCLARGCKTRASESNARFCEPLIQRSSDVDPQRYALLFDPQTSGGLLLCVAPDRASALMELAHETGARLACRIGEVVERRPTPLIVEN